MHQQQQPTPEEVAELERKLERLTAIMVARKRAAEELREQRENAKLVKLGWPWWLADNR